jgi:hypothetical protein
MTNGYTSTFGGIVTSNVYNDREQPTLLSGGVTGQNSIFSLCYDFHLAIAVNNGPCSFNKSSFGDNGNVYQIINNTRTDATNSVAFTYDTLNRILQANTETTSSNCWGEVYTTDAWGISLIFQGHPA